MSVVIIDGRVRVTYMPACANVGAPTLAELAAGTALEGFIRPDGLDISVTTNPVPTGNLGSTVDSERAGRRKPSIGITFHHDSPTDTPWNLLPYRTGGFIAVRRGIDKTIAYNSGDKLGVYPIEAGEPNESKPANDTTWDFMVNMFVTGDFNQRAVVA